MSLIKGGFMAIRELSFEEMGYVSGGNANSNYDSGRNTCSGTNNDSNQSAGRSSSGGFYSGLGQDVTNCNNGVIGGMIAGSMGGVWGHGSRFSWRSCCRWMFFYK